MAEIDRLKEAQGIMDQFAASKRQQMVQTALGERAYMLKLASTWALVDIAWSLRTLVLRTPVPK